MDCCRDGRLNGSKRIVGERIFSGLECWVYIRSVDYFFFSRLSSARFMLIDEVKFRAEQGSSSVAHVIRVSWILTYWRTSASPASLLPQIDSVWECDLRSLTPRWRQFHGTGGLNVQTETRTFLAGTSQAGNVVDLTRKGLTRLTHMDFPTFPWILIVPLTITYKRSCTMRFASYDGV